LFCAFSNMCWRYFVICTPCCAPWLRRAVRFQEMRRLYTLAHLGFFLRGVTLGTRASEANEIWGGLGLRENEIWAFVSIIITWNRLPRHGGLTSHPSQPPDPPLLYLYLLSLHFTTELRRLLKKIFLSGYFTRFSILPRQSFFIFAQHGVMRNVICMFLSLYVFLSVCLSVWLSAEFYSVGWILRHSFCGGIFGNYMRLFFRETRKKLPTAKILFKKKSEVWITKLIKKNVTETESQQIAEMQTFCVNELNLSFFHSFFKVYNLTNWHIWQLFLLAEICFSSITSLFSKIVHVYLVTVRIHNE